MRIRRLPQAIRDVDDIWQWIAEDDIEAADRWADGITEATDRLKDFPDSGAPRPDIGADVRSIVAGRYLIFYQVGPNSVDIVRIVHGARDLVGLLGQEPEE